jgi:hypothetical protein
MSEAVTTTAALVTILATRLSQNAIIGLREPTPAKLV